MFISPPEDAQPEMAAPVLGAFRAAGWRGRWYVPEAHSVATTALVACGDYDWQAVTRDGRPRSPLAAAFLACLRAARDDLAAEVPAASRLPLPGRARLDRGD